MEKVVVLVPLYKEKLNYLEEIAMDRIHKVLNNYKIIYITPWPFDIIKKYKAGIEYFDKGYFKSVETYSKLLLNPIFYKKFADFEYILICQLDVFLFADRLLEFCNLGYDYYGAPWINGTPLNVGKGTRLRFVGNGGLSLRNVEHSIAVLEKNINYAKAYKGNEDYFFSYFASKKYRVAPADISRQFCIETQVQKCMEMNKGELPFGIHAWERYNYKYWKPYIESYGYDLHNISVPDGEEDERNKKGILRCVSAGFFRRINDCLTRL